MASHGKDIPEKRPLSSAEHALVKWLLEHGESNASRYLDQLNTATVHSRCPCGCASINFAIYGNRPSKFEMQILSDYQWRDSNGFLFGAFVFAQDGMLAGLDLWSIDGQATPTELPSIEALEPCGTPPQQT